MGRKRGKRLRQRIQKGRDGLFEMTFEEFQRIKVMTPYPFYKTDYIVFGVANNNETKIITGIQKINDQDGQVKDEFNDGLNSKITQLKKYPKLKRFPNGKDLRKSYKDEIELILRQSLPVSSEYQQNGLFWIEVLESNLEKLDRYELQCFSLYKAMMEIFIKNESCEDLELNFGIELANRFMELKPSMDTSPFRILWGRSPDRWLRFDTETVMKSYKYLKDIFNEQKFILKRILEGEEKLPFIPIRGYGEVYDQYLSFKTKNKDFGIKDYFKPIYSIKSISRIQEAFGRKIKFHEIEDPTPMFRYWNEEVGEYGIETYMERTRFDRDIRLKNENGNQLRREIFKKLIERMETLIKFERDFSNPYVITKMTNAIIGRDTSKMILVPKIKNKRIFKNKIWDITLRENLWEDKNQMNFDFQEYITVMKQIFSKRDTKEKIIDGCIKSLLERYGNQRRFLLEETENDFLMHLIDKSVIELKVVKKQLLIENNLKNGIIHYLFESGIFGMSR